MDRRARAVTATFGVALACTYALEIWPEAPTPSPVRHPAPTERRASVDDPVLPAPLRERACGSYLDDPALERPNLARVVWARAQQLDERLHLTLEDEHTSATLREGLRATLRPRPEHHRAVRLLSEATDRFAGGLDHLAAASSVMGYRALADHDDRLALEMAQLAEGADPSDALPWVIDAMASSRIGTPRPEAMSHAFELEPHEPAIALATFLHFARAPELELPVRALGAYLEAVPSDVTMAREHATLALRYSIFRDAEVRERWGLRIRGGSSPEVADRALALADAALWDASSLLHLGRPPSITLWLYPSHLALEDANCMSPQTAAFYDGGIHLDEPALLDLEDARASLRHESVHAVLATLPQGAPAWFGEGVAQLLAGEDSDGARFDPLRRLRTWIPFAAMNGPLGEIDDAADARLAYGQALAMVLYLVDRRGEASLAEATRYLERGGDPDTLLEALGAPLDGPTLLAFLDERAPRTPD